MKPYPKRERLYDGEMKCPLTLEQLYKVVMSLAAIQCMEVYLYEDGDVAVEPCHRWGD